MDLRQLAVCLWTKVHQTIFFSAFKTDCRGSKTLACGATTLLKAVTYKPPTYRVAEPEEEPPVPLRPGGLAYVRGLMLR